MYERNQTVEERLGVKITSILDKNAGADAVVNRVTTVVQAGTHEYDIMAAACCTALNETLNGTFADLRKTSYIDFDKPYWSQGFNEAVEYHGAQYAATGSAVLALYRFAFATVFNKNLFDDTKVPYLYEDVRNNTWTLDRQIELVSQFYVDNGNGQQDLTGDIYGFASSDYLSVDPYWSSCDVDIISKDEDGDYDLTFESSKLHSVADKTLKLFYDNGQATYNFAHKGGDKEQEEIRDMFAGGWAAMATLRLMELEAGAVRNMSDKFGVVPMPKYDKNQKSYGTLLHDQFTVFCIPTTIEAERLDEMGAFLEALSAESYNRVRPAYYESTLRTKLVQDPESAQMMDVVIDSIYIDPGIIYVYALDHFHDRFRHIMNSKTNTVMSDYKNLTQTVRKDKLGTILKKLNALS